MAMPRRNSLALVCVLPPCCAIVSTGVSVVVALTLLPLLLIHPLDRRHPPQSQSHQLTQVVSRRDASTSLIVLSGWRLVAGPGCRALHVRCYLLCIVYNTNIHTYVCKVTVRKISDDFDHVMTYSIARSCQAYNRGVSNVDL